MSCVSRRSSWQKSSIASISTESFPITRSILRVMYARFPPPITSACGTVLIPAASAMDMTRCSASGSALKSSTCGFRINPVG